MLLLRGATCACRGQRNNGLECCSIEYCIVDEECRNALLRLHVSLIQNKKKKWNCSILRSQIPMLRTLRKIEGTPQPSALAMKIAFITKSPSTV
jgi:hypothetical protein